MDGLTRFYLICAGIGGLTSLARFGLQLIGTDDHDDAPGSESHDSDDSGFRLLSLQAIAYFLLMFGLVGAALHAQSGLAAPISALGATGAGALTVFVISSIFKAFSRLQSSGTLENETLVGCQGTVYQRIAAQSSGKVTVKHQNRLRELDSVGEDGAAFETGDIVKVVAQNQGMITVRKWGDG